MVRSVDTAVQMYFSGIELRGWMTREECEEWLDTPIEIAVRLQRSLPDGSLKLIEAAI